MLNKSTRNGMKLFVSASLLFLAIHPAISDQRISGEGNAQISGDGNNITSNDSTSNIQNSNSNAIVINIRTYANDIIEKLPENKRKLAGEVSDIALDLVEASATPNDAKAKDRITKKLVELSLSDYQASSNPFVAETNKTQLMCNNNFKFSYRGQNSGHQCTIFYINGKGTGWQCPGDTYSSKSNNQTLDVLYLEFSKDKKAPIFYYECKASIES